MERRFGRKADRETAPCHRDVTNAELGSPAPPVARSLARPLACLALPAQESRPAERAPACKTQSSTCKIARQTRNRASLGFAPSMRCLDAICPHKVRYRRSEMQNRPTRCNAREKNPDRPGRPRPRLSLRALTWQPTPPGRQPGRF